MSRASHDDFLLIYCEKGSGEVITDHFRGSVGQGDILLLPRGMAHKYHADSSEPWSIFWCHFRGQLAEEFVRHIGLLDNLPVLKGTADPALVSSFKSLLSIARTGYGKTAFVHCANQLRQILTLLARLRKKRVRMQKNFDFEAIRSYMLENVDQVLTLDELAAVGNLSKYHFARKYKELTGYTPLQHFAHLKIEHACYLLDSTGLSVGQISDQLGYDDPLYFSRLFKKTTGLAPSMYRQSTHR
ncbi:MmsAB operon transcriptional regulator MmsR [Biformimicrobium ophioploci]|uniref:MmsAB operon transcriptional regulator MmsR n=2 Tax=Biformimicrobium ophioploci TaxID=3036711 RepID=A0ABQ6M237_9GAMM|nr:MmsAB operon transcriptional regulator MmsR [Microbulbifer sp. NKW57]